MKDLLLDSNGDLLFVNGDLSFTDSVIQAIKIRLRWFVGEWRINQSYGIPYYEDVFIKKPNKILIEEAIREEIMTVDEVQGVQDVNIEIDSADRIAHISFTVIVNDEILKEEVNISVR